MNESDFAASLDQWRAHPDYPMISPSQTIRNERAFRRALWRARNWLLDARENRGLFKVFAKQHGIKKVQEAHIENAVIRLLFGVELAYQRVDEYAFVAQYWADHPDAPIEEAEQTSLESILPPRLRKVYISHAQREFVRTPLDYKAFLEWRINGKFDDFDVFPLHRPAGFDAFSIEWRGNRLLVNPPFSDGVLSQAMRYALEQIKAGNVEECVVFLAPAYEYQCILFAAVQAGEVELEVAVAIPEAVAGIKRPGRVPWLHRETGEPMKGPPSTAAFIIRPMKITAAGT